MRGQGEHQTCQGHHELCLMYGEPGGSVVAPLSYFPLRERVRAVTVD